MKNYKIIKFVVGAVFLSIFFSCGVSKEPVYTGSFWKNHNKDWTIKKWHLAQWNKLRSGIDTWEEQKYSLDSLRLIDHYIQDNTIDKNLKTISKLVNNKIQESNLPVVVVIEKVAIIKDFKNSTTDTVSLVVSVQENLKAKAKTNNEVCKVYNVIVGCYKENARAKVHLKELLDTGYRDSKIIVSKYGLSRVSIKEFLEKNLAVKFVNAYRSTRRDVWVYTRTIKKQ